MKFPVLLGVSLAANAALLTVVVIQRAGDPATKPTEVAPAVHALKAPGTDVGEKLGVSNVREKEQAENSWTRLRGGSLQQMVTNLRSMGYPPSAIRALLSSRISDEMAARRREMMVGVEDPPYWNKGRNMFNPKVAAAQREFYGEQQKILRELLGPDATDDNEISQYYRRRQYGDIAPEKAELIQRISSDYSEMRAEIYAKTNGMLMAGDRDQMAFLDKELRSDLAKVMTSQELENYEVRSSMAASTLRSQLTTFEPNEAEFRALFRATQAVEEKFGPMQGMFSQKQMEQRTELLKQQAKLELTAQRFAEFEQAIEPKYGMLNRVVARYELSPSVVPKVFAVQEDIMKRVGALSGAERTAQSPALVSEAEARIKPLLGAPAFDAYRAFAGQWIDYIKQPVSPAAPKR